MASYSSSHSSTFVYSYDVFVSFRGADVREGFLSHVHYHFANKRIRTFNDEKLNRGHTIGPELVKAIKESRVYIVVLSKNYASSSWCLDELVEILNCKKAFGRIVMTIFYDVDPSDVRKQRGDFGKAFEKTCEGKTEEKKQSWREALAHVADIAGEDSQKWANDAKMIQKIATDVLKNVIPSSEYGEKVRLDAHMNEVESLRWDDDTKMFGIWGVQIGKSTGVQLKLSIRSIKASLKILVGVDKEKQLANLLLDIITHHLSTVRESRKGEGDFYVLDDIKYLEDKRRLNTKGKEILTTVCCASRSIVTAENKKLLQAHGIYNIYYVKYLQAEEELSAARLSAYQKSSAEYYCDKISNKIDGFLDDIFD